jgi:ABC-type transporter MlaC component
MRNPGIVYGVSMAKMKEFEPIIDNKGIKKWIMDNG